MYDGLGASRLLDRRFPCGSKLCIQSGSAPLKERWLNKIEVEETIKHIKRPLGFTGFDRNNSPRRGTLYWMRGKISNVPNRIDSLSQMRG